MTSTCIPEALAAGMCTARLYIRPYTEVDYMDCQLLYSDPEITTFFDHGKPRSKLEIDEYLEERSLYYLRQELPFGLFSVFLKDSLTFIGQIDVVPTGEPGEVEIGWIFRREYQNSGYCSESVISFLIPFIETLSKQKIEASGKPIDRIIATAHPENKPSQRIMAKAGLFFYKKALKYSGKPRDWFELTLGDSDEN